MNIIKEKKGLLIAAVIIVVFFALGKWFVSYKEAAYQRPLPGIPTIAGIGTIPPLHEAMLNNPQLKEMVKDLKALDEAQLFVNFPEVDRQIAEIVFLWANITADEVSAATSSYYDPRVEVFLRKAYALPTEEPLAGNPLLGSRPWPRLFNRFKARLLMQANGVAIYKGPAVYNLEKDDINVSGVLSKKFFKDFSKFLEDTPDPKPYINNLLVFIDETKGLRRLSEEEKQMIKGLRTIGG